MGREATVSEADAATHEAAMRGAGLHLLGRERIDDSTWRYNWSASPPVPEPPPAPVSPPPPLARPAVLAATRPSTSPQRDTGLDARADELIAAYQETLTAARSLPVDLRAQVVHVVAESGEHAARQARLYHSEAVADRFDRFHNDLPDIVGKLYDMARGKAASWVGGQVAGLAVGGGVAAAMSKLYGLVGALAGGAVAIGTALMQFGAELIQHSAGFRLICLGLYAGGGYLANQAHKDLEAARHSAQPAQSLLASSLNAPERAFFTAAGGQPPGRATLNLSGPAGAMGLAVVIGLIGLAAGLIVFGILMRISATPDTTF